MYLFRPGDRIPRDVIADRLGEIFYDAAIDDSVGADTVARHNLLNQRISAHPTMKDRVRAKHREGPSRPAKDSCAWAVHQLFLAPLIMSAHTGAHCPRFGAAASGSCRP
ncbi:hypothetical protein B9C99_19520 [Rhodococcus sp. BUPNP1]|nr:hypothetical protein B9C99_19520 [Rhodococcus sp. BUPNP1]